eukprot:g17655.t1
MGGTVCAALSLAVVMSGCRGVGASWLPSIGPKEFETGDQLPLYVNELTSLRTQTTLDHYHVAYCRPEHLHENAENIGAYLEGDREENSLYDLKVGEEQFCTVLCNAKLNAQERYMFANVIRDGYMAHMTITHLPAAYETRDSVAAEQAAMDSGGVVEKQPIFLRGFPVGFQSDGKSYLHNHLRITVAINPRNDEQTKFHVVGFLVEPFSVQHEFQAPWTESTPVNTCGNKGYSSADPRLLLSTEYDGEILFTYDVLWDITPMPWTQRWDIYMNGPEDNQIHWFSITNSSVIVMFLTVLVAMIMVRALRKDIQRYNAEDMEEANEETGWKLVHGDVLRPPTTAPMLFAVCVGTGVQLWSVSFLVLFFSMVRLVSPLKRGDILTVCILIYVLTGGIAGYNAAKIHRRFRGTEWIKVVRTNQIPRMIPQTPWYVDPKVAVPFAGVLPFGAVLVELVFVMTAMWEQQLYYIFGFLMSVMLILTVTCAEISIVMCYFQLCSEDYRWWWRSLLWSGSCAGWMFIYSVGYYFTVLHMTGWMAASLFFGYTFVMTACFFLLTGTVGYFSCQWFINVIYSSIKVD